MSDININEEDIVKDENNTPKNSGFKRVVAWICIIMLGLLYLGSLVLALMGYGVRSNLLMACILGTLVVPILGFIVIWLYSRYNDLKAPGDPQ